MYSIIYGGQEFPCSHEVRTFKEHKMKFEVPRGARKRTGTIELCVVHHSAGEGNASTIFNTLNMRGLGVDFFIDREGVIWQFSDPKSVATFHAGIANNRGIGIEIANYGYRADEKDIPPLGRDRKTYETIIHGTNMKMASFYECQETALRSLLEAIHSAIPSIPLCAATVSSGKLLTNTKLKQLISDDKAGSAKSNRYKGIVAHLQISDEKLDPGTETLQKFLDSGFLSGMIIE